MEINQVAGSSGSSAEAGRTRLAENFDNFLTLLTVQLQNQDPLDPLDANEFTQQLVELTSVEQAIATNANLEKLLDLASANQAASALGYLGKEIEALGETTALAGGKAEWNYSLDEPAEAVTVTVRDASGKLVFSGEGETGAGEHAFIWDGLSNQGVPQPEGLYTIAVTATDSAGEAIATSTKLIGKVTAVDSVDGVAVLIVGGLKVPVAAVLSVREATNEI